MSKYYSKKHKVNFGIMFLVGLGFLALGFYGIYLGFTVSWLAFIGSGVSIFLGGLFTLASILVWMGKA